MLLLRSHIHQTANLPTKKPSDVQQQLHHRQDNPNNINRMMTEQEQASQAKNLRKEAIVPTPANVFSSIDFEKFLNNNDLPTSGGVHDTFLSKELSLPGFDVSTIFKSKDTFSQLFNSSEWKMKLPRQDVPSENQDLPPLKTMTIPSVVAAPAPAMAHEAPPVDSLTSRDWMTSKTLGPHMDVNIRRDMLFRECSSEPELSIRSDTSTALPPAKTDWDNMFFSQLQLMPLPTPTERDSVAIEEVPAAELASSAPAIVVHDSPVPGEESSLVDAQSTASSTAQSDTKKRKRKPRKKVVPEVKQYVAPQTNDVLLGRGGRSNHHPGNKRYREEVKNLRTWYSSIGDNKDEKTALSQCLVDYVHNYNGRFLEKDAHGWYEVPNIVARRKASQALREDDDPEKRAAKRARFLQKKALEGQTA